MKGPIRRMRTEQQALKVSLAAILLVSVLGIGFGLVSGSFAILFDGVFSLMDAVMSVVSLTVAGLISRSVTNRLSRRTQNAFTMGFWHFEPIVLLVNSTLMMGVAAYALVQAVSALLNGGREVDFGPAVVYAAVVVVITVVMGVLEHRANKRIRSEFVAMDVKGWIMAGGVTGACSSRSSSACSSTAPRRPGSCPTSTRPSSPSSLSSSSPCPSRPCAKRCPRSRSSPLPGCAPPPRRSPRR